MEEAVRFQNVWYRYPRVERYALSGLDISIPYKKCTLIVGPSGSGKSTFVFLARGLNKQFVGGELKGKIFIHGKDIETLDFLYITHTGVGWVGQDPTLNLHQLTVYDEVLSSPIYFNLPWERCVELANKIIGRMSIASLSQKSPIELSGGQMQRVAVAAALSMGGLGNGRELLLLDEPSSFLDPRGKRELIELLTDLKNQGATLVVVTHDIETFVGLADKVVLLSHGTKIKEGDKRDILYSKELDDFVGAPLYVKIAKNIPNATSSKPVSMEELLSRLDLKSEEKRIENEERITRASEPFLSFNKVSFGYADGLVFEDLNFSLPSGKIIALIGNNGSGKTTLVKLGLGLLSPTKGKILLFGKDPAKFSAADLTKNVTYITQIPRDMFIANNVKEECRITPKNLNLDKIEEIVETAVKRAKLSELANSSVDSLSGGERRLLTLAATAFVSNPKLLILDEPEYGVDPNTWWYLFDMIRELKKEGKTIIMLTHFMDVTLFCDHVVMLSDGKIIDEGSPLEVYRRGEFRKTRVVPPSIFPLVEKIFEKKVESIDELLQKIRRLYENQRLHS